MKDHKLKLRLSTDKHRIYRFAKRGGRKINKRTGSKQRRTIWQMKQN